MLKEAKRTKLRAIVIDHDDTSKGYVSRALGAYVDIDLMAMGNTGKQALNHCLKSKVDLLFIDYVLQDMSGIEVVKKLHQRLRTPPLVIFITHSSEGAIDAFKVNAVDYILKPLEAGHLDRAIERAHERLVGRQALCKSSVIEIDERQGSASRMPKIVVKDRGIVSLIEQAEIDTIEAAGDYMCIRTKDQTHIMRSTMKSLIRQLSPDVFQRVHRSTVINMNQIETIIPRGKGEYLLELSNNSQIKVSRNYSQVIKDFLSRQAKGAEHSVQ